MRGRVYEGRELELFAGAKTWKNYLRSFLRGYLRGSVLEVGAGIGGTTLALCDGRRDSWLCLEPDERLAGVLRKRVERGDLPACCRVREGTLEDLGAGEKFDAVLYVDVLEHIADDRRELEKAAAFLRRGGFLAAVVPAHEILRSPFDDRCGHYRRYRREGILGLTPPGMAVREARYLDSVGFLCSLLNRFFLRQGEPSAWQVLTWDRLGIPLSRGADRMVGFSFGRSFLVVWQKQPQA